MEYLVHCGNSSVKCERFFVRLSARTGWSTRFVWKSHYDFCPVAIIQGKGKPDKLHILLLVFVIASDWDKLRRSFFSVGLGRDCDAKVGDISLNGRSEGFSWWFRSLPRQRRLFVGSIAARTTNSKRSSLADRRPWHFGHGLSSLLHIRHPVDWAPIACTEYHRMPFQP